MKRRYVVWLSVLLSLALVDYALAQPLGVGAVRVEDYDRLFNLQTVENLKGEVLSVDVFSPGTGIQLVASHVSLRLKTDKETIEVYLGPQPYIDRQNIRLAAQDKVVVKGSRITREGKPLIIAMGVRKGDQVLRLRDSQGKSGWSRDKGSGK